MWSFGVVVNEPGVEIGLQGLEGFVAFLAHGDAEELVEDVAVEALDGPVGLRRPDPDAQVFDVVDMKKEVMCLVSAELTAVLGENGAYRQVEMAVETQHPVMPRS